MSHVQMLLPRNLAALAKCCATADPLRYGATTGVQLESLPNGYRATVTDGRQLASVEGVNPHPPENYPAFPALDSAPNTGTCNVIEGRDWTAAFKSIPKGRRAAGKPILETLAVVLGDTVTTLASTDLATCQASTPPNLLTQDRGSGKLRFPDWKQCLPRDKPKFSLNVDARVLANMLEVAGAFSVGTGVRLDFYGGGKPFKISSYDNDEQQFTGLMVPLVDGANGSKTTVETSVASEADTTELQTLKNAHAAELKQYAATMHELREQLADAIDARSTMAATIKDPAAKIKDLEEACAEWSKEADELNSKLFSAGYDTIDGVIADLHSNEDKVADLENAHEIDARRISEAWTRINNLETANGLLRAKLERRAKRK